MIYRTQDIQKAVRWLSEGKEVAYVISEKNGNQLFTFAYWQLRYRTFRSFRTIVYAKERDFLFYLLRFVSLLSLGYYTLIEQEA
jgi:hypothetical protein